MVVPLRSSRRYPIGPGFLAPAGINYSLMQPKVMVIVPARNEEGAIGGVVRSVRAVMPDAPVLVIDDHSEDATADIAEQAGGSVIRLPIHLGLGGCVQTGYKLAYSLGCDYVVRVDGDGQHEAADI